MTYGTIVALALEGAPESPSVHRASRLTEGPGVSCRTPALATPCAYAAVLAHAGLSTWGRKHTHFLPRGKWWRTGDFLESDFIIKIYLYENDRINPNWYWLCMRLYGIPGCSSARRCQAGRPGSMLDRSDLVGTGTGRSQGHRHPRWNTCISLKKIILSLLSPHRALTYQHRYYIKLHVIINLVLLYLFYFIIFMSYPLVVISYSCLILLSLHYSTLTCLQSTP